MRRCARRDAESLTRIRDLRVVFQALHAHVVREVLAAERDGDDALAGFANRRDVDDGFGRLDPRHEPQHAEADTGAALETADELRDRGDVSGVTHFAYGDSEHLGTDDSLEIGLDPLRVECVDAGNDGDAGRGEAR